MGIGSSIKDGIAGGIVSKLVLDQDTTIRNNGVKDRLDWVGEFLTDLKEQWNASVTATDLTGTITTADYDSKDYE